MNAKLERWQEALESKGFNINHTKTEYMDYNFSEHLQRAETTVRIEAQEIPQRDSFYYLDTRINKGKEIDENVKYRIRAGSLK